MIRFNKPPYVNGIDECVLEAVHSDKICGDGEFTKKCSLFLQNKFGAKKILLTTSGSTALDMAAFLCGIHPGDEVILPSFTFSSTANSFLLAGAKLVFVDIRKDTMNIDETKIEKAITNKTKAICVVHYAGVACEMESIMKIAKRYNLFVVEDAAQAVMSQYNGKYLGTIGHFGCFSFHETKNYSMGEGGAIVINDEKYIERAEILREKGTDRSKFLRGQVDKYTWVEFGDSYLPSELNAAYLWPQLLVADSINDFRINCWNYYYESLKGLERDGYISLPYVPNNCTHNAHMFYIKVSDISERTELIQFLKNKDIQVTFHYVPLHSSPAGLKYGRFCGEDVFTTKESEKLLRLPLFYGLTMEEQKNIVETIKLFFLNKKGDIK